VADRPKCSCETAQVRAMGKINFGISGVDTALRAYVPPWSACRRLPQPGKKLGGRWVHLTTDAPLHSIGDAWQRKRSSAHGRVARPTHLSAPHGRSDAVSDSAPSAAVQHLSR
jgi:hypothetical protein